MTTPSPLVKGSVIAGNPVINGSRGQVGCLRHVVPSTTSPRVNPPPTSLPVLSPTQSKGTGQDRAGRTSGTDFAIFRVFIFLRSLVTTSYLSNEVSVQVIMLEMSGSSTAHFGMVVSLPASVPWSLYFLPAAMTTIGRHTTRTSTQATKPSRRRSVF
jgi:hypothetical protein